jgi:hypothetical protein
VRARPAVVAGLHQARRPGRSLTDAQDAAEAPGRELVDAEDGDLEVVEQRDGLVGEPLRRLLERRCVDEVARHGGRPRHGEHGVEVVLPGVRTHDRHGRQRPRRGLGLAAERVGREQQPLRQGAQDRRRRPRAAHVDDQRRGGLRLPGDRSTGLAQVGRGRGAGADEQHPLELALAGQRHADDLARAALRGLARQQGRDVELEPAGSAPASRADSPSGTVGTATTAAAGDSSARTEPGSGTAGKEVGTLGEDGLERPPRGP